jgi:hypothetical protein
MAVHWQQKARFKVMPESECSQIYRKVQRLATMEDYGHWWNGKDEIAAQHKIHRNHVNSIIRRISGKSSSVPKLHRIQFPKDKIHFVLG